MLAYDFNNNEQPHIDILFGLGHYWDLIERCVKLDHVDCGLVCQNSVYGWLISDCTNGSSPSVILSHQLLTLGDMTNTSIKNLWGIK